MPQADPIRDWTDWQIYPDHPVYVGFSRMISTPIGSQIVTSAFSVHTWCTRTPECTGMVTFSIAFQFSQLAHAYPPHIAT
jgi:hypothetical protein